MKLWVDAQLSPALANWINHNFSEIEAVPVRELGLRSAEDLEIFFSAKTTDAVVMTKDSDFVELQQRNGPPPTIIWITCGNTSNSKLKSILSLSLQEAVNLLKSGEILVEIAG